MTKTYEFVRGRWVVDSSKEPEALVVWSPSHKVWCWWARGMVGDAPTPEAAKARAEAALEKP